MSSPASNILSNTVSEIFLTLFFFDEFFIDSLQFFVCPVTTNDPDCFAPECVNRHSHLASQFTQDGKTAFPRDMFCRNNHMGCIPQVDGFCKTHSMLLFVLCAFLGIIFKGHI